VPFPPTDPFDYRTATESEILARAQPLEDRLLGEIPGATFSAKTGGTGRHEVGRAIETYFGMPASSASAPDFPGAGIELKVVPLAMAGREFRTKERTVVSLIDYTSLAEQTWSSAKIRGKLRILFVFFRHVPDVDKQQFPVDKVVLWEPTGEVADFIHADWLEVRRQVRAGQAHLLSEAVGRLMGPCTKGADSSVRVKQPFSNERAKPRAFALKPALTKAIYQEAVGSRGAVESLIKNLGIDKVDTFESRVLSNFERYVGRTVRDVASELGIPRSTGKSFAAGVVRRALGAKTTAAKVAEFALMGLTPRVVRVMADRMPYESTSFPYFRYKELVQEEWEDSTLLSQLEYMLFVPIFGSAKATPQVDCTLGVPVFWQPSLAELQVIRAEWERFQREIREGKADHLTGASETTAIHVRPHGRDSQDTDEAPVVGPVVKKSFWLNRPFVQQILFESF
jgi:DNA mismatch repair protein MutH